CRGQATTAALDEPAGAAVELERSEIRDRRPETTQRAGRVIGGRQFCGVGAAAAVDLADKCRARLHNQQIVARAKRYSTARAADRAAVAQRIRGRCVELHADGGGAAEGLDRTRIDHDAGAAAEPDTMILTLDQAGIADRGDTGTQLESDAIPR